MIPPTHPMKPSMLRRRRQSAFTLVEMLLVLVILATLAAIVIPKMAGRSQQAKVTAAKADISSVGMALESFEVDNGYYPKSLDELQNAPSNAPGWKGPYLSKGVPPDPWGNPYIYECPGKHSNGGYDLMSGGPDARSGTDDDITSWDTKR